MKREDIEKKVIEIAEDMFKKEVSGDFETLNLIEYLDLISIDVLEYLLSIESSFDFEFGDEALGEDTLQSGKILLDTIEQYI